MSTPRASLKEKIEAKLVEAERLQQMAGDHEGYWSYDGYREALRDVLTLLDAEPEQHRCSGCDRRWDGPAIGAELCGDCWRKCGEET
jgi:hypothetical protein